MGFPTAAMGFYTASFYIFNQTQIFPSEVSSLLKILFSTAFHAVPWRDILTALQIAINVRMN